MSEVLLQPIKPHEYDIWIVESKKNYTDENIKSGLTPKEAQKKTDEDFARYLTHGLSSPDHYIFSIVAEGLWMGTLWVGVRGPNDNRKAFIYDIVLKEAARGKGYGKKAMLLLEAEVKKLGLRHIGLHVFGHNKVARSLYENLGYEITNLNMEKVL